MNDYFSTLKRNTNKNLSNLFTSFKPSYLELNNVELGHEMLLLSQHLQLLETEIEMTEVFGQCMWVALLVGENIELLLEHDEVALASLVAMFYQTEEPTH